MTTVEVAVHPHHTDTTVNMRPYLKIRLPTQLRKAQGDTFYEAAREEDGMLSYDFACSKAEGSGEVHIRQS